MDNIKQIFKERKINKNKGKTYEEIYGEEICFDKKIKGGKWKWTLVE